MQDNEYDKYDLDYIIDKFEGEPHILFNKTKDSFPQEDDDFVSLTYAMHIMAKEIKALRKDVDDLNKSNHFKQMMKIKER